MERVVPWAALVQLVGPHALDGKKGRPHQRGAASGHLCASFRFSTPRRDVDGWLYVAIAGTSAAVVVHHFHLQTGLAFSIGLAVALVMTAISFTRKPASFVLPAPP